MPATWERWEEATEVVRGLLEDLGLETFLFEVHAKGGRWEVRVECGAAGGPWQMTTLEADGDALTPPTGSGPRDREQILEAWRSHFGACLAPRGEA